MDQIVNQAAKIHYMYSGKASVPLVMRTAGGSGTGAGAQHSQSLENWMAHIPGLKVIQPSNAYDAKGLLRAAIEDDNPVMFYEHKLLYKTEMSVPETSYSLPIGVADIKRTGEDVTIIATGIMVAKALSAAKILSEEGISVEVVDPRTLVPLDAKTLLSSVNKTKRVVVVTESVKNSGFGAEINRDYCRITYFIAIKNANCSIRWSFCSNASPKNVRKFGDSPSRNNCSVCKKNVSY